MQKTQRVAMNIGQTMSEAARFEIISHQAGPVRDNSDNNNTTSYGSCSTRHLQPVEASLLARPPWWRGSDTVPCNEGDAKKFLFYMVPGFVQ